MFDRKGLKFMFLFASCLDLNLPKQLLQEVIVPSYLYPLNITVTYVIQDCLCLGYLHIDTYRHFNLEKG